MTRARLSIALVVLAFLSMRAVGNGAGAQQAPTAPPPGVSAGPCGQTRVYGGTPIDVDFQGSDLRTTLRLLADTGGINLVLDPSVPTNARVDIKLTQVPWDQVLDVLLRGNMLTCIADGSVVRVLTRDSRTKELDEETKQRRASEQLPDLEKLQVRLNYASAAAMKELIKQGRIISDRGTVDIDLRTNTLIVKDVARNLVDVQDLVRTLDLPEPQVEIEAQIIETDHDSARALGIQWGFNGRATTDLGNTTSLGFPNSGTIGGRTGSQQGASVGAGADPRATSLERSGTAVNLPATGATSAVGLTLGAINGAFNLDVALSALQHKGRLKILSTPKVTTQNNKEAEVTTGFQVPFQTISNNTVVIQFRDAALKLAVTPQVTAAGTVIMKVALSNDFPDFSRAVNGNPSINTQRAVTEVQVADGVTTVIGGILQSKDQIQNDSTPGVGNVPLLGWLFRRNTNSSESQELLIFITPRIQRVGP
jgi:type IV pilus assembly protein PilQ